MFVKWILHNPFKRVNAIVMCLTVETARLTTDIFVLISAGTTNATLWRLRKSDGWSQMISGTFLAQVWTCCLHPPLWLMQHATLTSRKKTTGHAVCRKTSSHSLPTWQVLRHPKTKAHWNILVKLGWGNENCEQIKFLFSFCQWGTRCSLNFS